MYTYFIQLMKMFLFKRILPLHPFFDNYYFQQFRNDISLCKQCRVKQRYSKQKYQIYQDLPSTINLLQYHNRSHLEVQSAKFLKTLDFYKFVS